MTERWAAQWARVAGDLSWDEPWHTLHTPDTPYGRWFAGGRINLAANCVGRHAARHGARIAVQWEGEPGDRRELTYRELHDEVRAFASVLRGLGVGPGDRVALHLGWLPETVVAMLGCAHVGAVHTVVPTPLPAEALAERLADFGPRLLVTQDGAWRHGTILPLKARADEALTAVGGVEQTVVVRRTGVDVAWYAGDRWWHELRAAIPEEPAPPVALEAEHRLLATPMATRRGRPVSALHGTANILAAAAAVHRYGLSPGGVFWCAGDIAWLGIQVHGVYGPLSWGDTAVMFEGTLDVPSRDRAWEIVARYGVATLVTSPSVVRRLRGWAQRPPAHGAVASLRRIVTLGEALDSELADWLRHRIGAGGIDVADAWGQIELGGIVSVDRPVAPALLPDPASPSSTAVSRCRPAGAGNSFCATRGREPCARWRAPAPPTPGGTGSATRAAMPPATSPATPLMPGLPAPGGDWPSTAAWTRWSASPASSSR
ncbi:AMP-binding protein [Allosalinactinospora lopnorensis]|uniref:AMP-binding protein n=1 Tax=Allosalinactinospora lopnorensis TaxID=1352348 RepID=UPI000697AEEF|nr:AMP-binding protein [Allosalinactinospora lopnorensis]